MSSAAARPHRHRAPAPTSESTRRGDRRPRRHRPSARSAPACRSTTTCSLSLAKHSLIDLTVQRRRRHRRRRPPHRRGRRDRARAGACARRSATSAASPASATPPCRSTRRWCRPSSTSPAAPTCVHEGEPTGQEYVVIGGHLRRLADPARARVVRLPRPDRPARAGARRPRPAPRRRGPVQGARPRAARRRGPRPPRRGASRARRVRSSPWLPTCGRDAGHGLVLVRRSPAARHPVAAPRAGVGHRRPARDRGPASRWPTTGPAAPPPYDVGLEVLAARPAPWRARPTIGFFDVHGRAAVTVQPTGPRAAIHWLVWEPRRGVVATPQLAAAAPADARSPPPARRAGCARRRSPTCCAPGDGAPLDLLVTVLGLLGLPGRDLLVRGDAPGASDVEPSVRGILAFDRLMAEEAAHRVRDRRRPRGPPVSASVVVLDYGSGNIRSRGARARARRRRRHPHRRPGGRAGRRRPVRARGRQLPRLHGRAGRRRRAEDHRPAAGRRAPGAGRLRRHAGDVRGVDRAERVTGRRGRRVAGHRRRGCWPRSCRTWAGRRSRCRSGRCCSTASRASGSTSCTPTPRTPGSWARPTARSPPSSRWSPGPTHGERFVAAVENGPLSATQFHPEKSGEAGLALLRNWVRSL